MAKTIVPPGTEVVITRIFRRDGYRKSTHTVDSVVRVTYDMTQPNDFEGWVWLEGVAVDSGDYSEGWCQFRPAKGAVGDSRALFEHLAKLGPRGLAVLTAVAARLAKGAAEHGDFENLSRDWNQEALEEDLDGLVYRTVGAMQRAGQL